MEEESMKKSNFIALILGTVSCMFFGLGMCMALLPEWNAFKPGIAIGCVGALFALITILVWRKMEHKEPVRISGKTILTAIFAVAGALVLGTGMCLAMVWSYWRIGIVIGSAGIFMLLCLIPICKGVK